MLHSSLNVDFLLSRSFLSSAPLPETTMDTQFTKLRPLFVVVDAERTSIRLCS